MAEFVATRGDLDQDRIYSRASDEWPTTGTGVRGDAVVGTANAFDAAVRAQVQRHFHTNRSRRTTRRADTTAAASSLGPAKAVRDLRKPLTASVFGVIGHRHRNAFHRTFEEANVNTVAHCPTILRPEKLCDLLDWWRRWSAVVLETVGAPGFAIRVRSSIVVHAIHLHRCRL